MTNIEHFIEIGIALMVILGKEGVLFVYLATVLALCLSFFIGRLVPVKLIAKFSYFFQLKKACYFVLKIDKLEPKNRVIFLLDKIPNKLLPIIIKHRYILVATLLNIPGNGIIGGGGGIALVAGMSRLFNIYY
mgnify:CR=1 FL=1